MKKKLLLLLAACSLVASIGYACKDAPDSSSESVSVSSNEPPHESVVEEKIEKITLNQNEVTLCVGESFTLIADAEGVTDAAFSWSVDGDADSEVLSLSTTGNIVVISALKVGQTKLVASITQDETTYFKTVDVTVKAQETVSLVVSDNVGFNEDGYYTQLWTLPTDAGDNSVQPIVSAYKNNKLLPNVTFTWVSEDSSVVKAEGNKFTAVSEGFTHVVGICEVEGKTYTLSIAVDVCRPVVVLDERFVVETENLTKLAISSTVNGVASEVTYKDKAVGEYNAQTKTVTLTKAQLPKLSAEMGENCPMFIETSLARYQISVDLYTKIIKTAEDFETFSSLSKNACPKEPALWDGYFVLGNDITYNGLYNSQTADINSLWAAVEGSWSNGGLYGFRGVFDGKGYTIDGVSIDNGNEIASVFGVLHIDGVIKNISFTNASVGANSSFVCSAGGGTVENVYVQYNAMGKGAQRYEADGSVNNYCATFFGYKEPTATANVSNCVVDVTKATFNMGTAIKIVGSEFVSLKNVFVIGGTEELRKKSNATLSFPSMIDFVEDNVAQGRYKKFSDAFWSQVGGAAISKSVYEKICGAEVNFTQTVECLVSGTSYQLLLDNSYVKWSTNNDAVEIVSGVAKVSSSAENGEKVTITATSLFDESKTATFTCTVAVVDKANCVDLTAEEETAFYDWSLHKVYFADLSNKLEGEALYFVDEGFASASFAKDGEGVQTLYAVTKDKFYKFNCLSVTKVIEKAEDLHYVRKDYTVSSYNNPGCYDGKTMGTFVLINDIDCTGLTLKNTGRYWENSRGFSGIFDGRGYTISNLSVGENGLFGSLTYATIKNVTFTGVRLLPASQGAYVSLFATRVFNTTMENVSVQFDSYVVGDTIYATSGLLFYETSFDSVFKNVTIDISKISGVKYLTECYYNEDPPYLSEKKSTYENITVVVASLDDKPVFAYKTAQDGADNVVEYPDGFTFKTA